MTRDFFENRFIYIQVFFAIAALALLVKLFEIQVLDSEYTRLAKDASIRKINIYPARGEIYDRNGKLIVHNKPIYDLMVTYNQIDAKMDTTKFCELLDIDKEYFKKALNKDWKSPLYSKSRPFLFLTKIPAKNYTRFRESLYQFPGFFIQSRSVRSYPYPHGAHVLGSIREVNGNEVKDSSEVYSPGDYIGATGLEKSYEYYLRGQKGIENVLRNSRGKTIGSYKNGQFDVKAKTGMDLYTTIDIELQAYAEELLANKAGSIVALDPKTGEILCMSSAPSYDPNVLTIGQKRTEAFQKLSTNPNLPFINRATYAQYPPGSLFKTAVALIAMEEGVLSPNRTIPCDGAYYFNGTAYTGCHHHPLCTDVSTAIQYSCNTYFITVFRELIDQYSYTKAGIGLDTFNTYLHKMGLGQKLYLDIPGEKSGYIPSSEYYDKVYKDEGRWFSMWIRSLGIGQGEILTTNIQLANLAAIIANRGYYYQPHLVKKLIDKEENNSLVPIEFKKHESGISDNYFEYVVNGMEKAVTSGTAPLAYIWDIPICGKTGTAENNQGSKKDHSIFFAFAPKDDPKIALVVYVENSGFGGSYAAPIASLMIEKYLRGEIPEYRKPLERRIMNTNLLDQ